MVTFKRFLMESKLPKKETEGTYVCVKFTEESSKQLFDFAKSIGLNPISPKDMHVTIVYSKKRLNLEYGKTDVNFSVKPGKLRYLGKKSSKWRALALVFNSKKLQDLHESFKEYGYVHLHDDYIAHVSLAYQPIEGLDINKIKVPEMDLRINSMVIESLKI